MRVDATSNPTPYADVNAILNRLRADVQRILGDRFVGMYLYGSLASGDFNPRRSDIDFVVVTDSELPDEVLPTLEAMHTRLAESGLPWTDRLEGSYIPRGALRRYDPADAHHPHVGVGESFGVAHHDHDWVINRHVLREEAVVLAGPPPRTLIDPVTLAELRRAVADLLRSWWAPMVHDDARLRGQEYQPYAVLTMCRALYALEHSRIASKPVAAQWAMDALGPPWAELIRRALDWEDGIDIPVEDYPATQRLIALTLERI